MKCLVFLFLLTAVADASVDNGRAREKVTAIEKVIELLTRLSAKVEEEGKAEAAAYDKYACFCKEQADEKLYNIETSKDKIEKLTAKIEKLTAEITELTTEISDLATKISGLEEDITAAVDKREKEHEKYVANSTECEKAISAIERAIKALKESKKEIKGNEYYDAKVDLAQLHAAALKIAGAADALTSTKVHTALEQLSQEPPPSPGKPAGYEYQSNDIIATLEGLKDSFLELKKDMDIEEFKLKDAFEKKKLALENEKKFAEKEKAEKEAVLEAKTEEKEAAEEDKTEETKDMEADQSFMDVLTGECETKASLWDQRSKTRAGELKALSEATTILKDKAVEAYDVNKKLVDLQKGAVHVPTAAVKKAASFLQMRSLDTQEENKQAATNKALQVLSDAAKKLGSHVLSTAVLRVTLSKDHFIKVRGLIKDLIARLEKQAEEEQEQKSFCDKEMGKATGNRDSANAGIEDALAEIKKLESEKKLLTEEVAKLTQEVADLQKALLEATELRAQEKAENEETIETANQGKDAVDFALSVLKEFYEGAAGFLQKYVPPNSDREGNTVGDLAPEVFDSEYKGAQEESKGIIGILEVIKSDFERTVQTTTDEEAAAQEAFEKFEADTKQDIADKEASIKKKEERLTEIEDEITTQQDTLKDQKELLEKAEEELSKLKTMCVEGEETYEERVEARKREIEALKEALAILENYKA